MKTNKGQWVVYPFWARDGYRADAPTFWGRSFWTGSADKDRDRGWFRR